MLREDSQTDVTLRSAMIQHKIYENDISSTSETPKDLKDNKHNFVSKIVFAKNIGRNSDSIVEQATPLVIINTSFTEQNSSIVD